MSAFDSSKSQHLLAIETSGKSLGVALQAGSSLLFEENVSAGAIHGRVLAPLIQKALKSCSFTPADLNAIAISAGPGSWTGLRIGISAAKALAWGIGCAPNSRGMPALVPVPSFEALANEAVRHAPQHAVLTLRDARSEGFFAALFYETSEGFERWITESVMNREETLATVAKEMQKHNCVPLVACGDRVCLDAIAQDAQREGWQVLTSCEHISAAAVAAQGWQRWQRGEALKTASEIHSFAPLYLRASDPELKLKQKD